MEKVYLISGLGADERLFKHLELKGVEVVHAYYFEPDEHDSLASYAKKMIDTYHIEANSNVLGVSFGGMLTVEIAQQIPLKNVIIVSTIKSADEAPAYYPFYRAFPVYKLIPGKVLRSLGFVFKPFFFKQMGGESRLFDLMLRNSSPKFLKWAMNAALSWKQKPLAQTIHHIIGDADLVFNYKKVKNPIVIEGGDHVMIFTRGKQIGKLVTDILAPQHQAGTIAV